MTPRSRAAGPGPCTRHPPLPEVDPRSGTLGLPPPRGTRPGAWHDLGLLRWGSFRFPPPSFSPLPAPPAPCATGTGSDTDLGPARRCGARSCPAGIAAAAAARLCGPRCGGKGGQRPAGRGRCGAAVRGGAERSGGRCRPAPRLAPVGGAAARPAPGRAAPAHLPGVGQDGPAPGPRGCREEGRCPQQGDPAVERQGEGQRKRRKSRESQRR